MGSAAGCSFLGIAYVEGRAWGELVASGLELSFWGGVDPVTGHVIDRHHPLNGACLAGKVLAIPGGRGSCSGSGVLLELMLNGKAPSAIVFEREDDILTLGVIVAEEIFGQSIPVVRLAPYDFAQIGAHRFVGICGASVTCSDEPVSPLPAFADEAGAGEAFGELALSEADQAFLKGAQGRAAQSAMRIITRMARLQRARRLIDVTRVHIDGCVYTGPGALRFAERLREMGGRVAIPTTLNAISVDHTRWREQGVDPALGGPATRLADAYTDMGALPTFTCAPYLLDELPRPGEQIAWAESNAVVFANSVLGARTMKYPDFLDACIALTGRAPHAGAHLDDDRFAVLGIEVSNAGGVDDAFYPLLGYRVGGLAGSRIPVVTGLENASPSNDDLKAFGAAFATVSSAPMFHIVGVTPEASRLCDALPPDCRIQWTTVAPSDLRADWEKLNGTGGGDVDLVSLGNPHFSQGEIERFAALCRGREKHPAVAVVITTGRGTYERVRLTGAVAALEAFGARFVTDTCWCMIGEPIIPPAARSIMTNSAKYAHYGPGLTGRLFRFGSLAACAQAAVTGSHPGDEPAWMSGPQLG